MLTNSEGSPRLRDVEAAAAEGEEPETRTRKIWPSRPWLFAIDRTQRYSEIAASNLPPLDDPV